MNRLLLAVLLLVVVVPSGRAQKTDLPAELEGVKFDQKLGEQVPPDAKFKDDRGRDVRLEKYFGEKPVLFVLAYYRCPRLCSVVLKGMVDSVRQLNLLPGKDFNIVVISVDHREGPALSAPKKQSALEAYGREGTDQGWHFLTGEESEIKRVADAVGFGFVWDQSSDVIRHPSGIMILTPKGIVARYFFGFQYPASNLRLGLIEASENRISAPVDRALLFACYTYDAESGRYLISPMKLMRISALLTVLALGVYLASGWFRRASPAKAISGIEQGAK